MILCYTTCKNKSEAKRIARHLLGKKLVACANMFGIRALYFWKNALRDEPECFLLMKTQAKHWGAIQREIKKLHSYELPALVRLGAQASAAFERWVSAETSTPGPKKTARRTR
jgi:periplasmic divalent cation tolerance protein